MGSLLSGQSLEALEAELRTLHRKVMEAPTQAERFEANEILMGKLNEALRLDPAIKYPFDSLKTLSLLMPPDKQFRIFSWYVPHQDGTFTYFGVIQRWDARHKKSEAFWLEDQSSEISNAEEALLLPENWYGALYYDIIPIKSRGRTYYTLLGWDGNMPQVNRKIIEVLHFRAGNAPVFGHYLFRGIQGKKRRILFEYSGRASMTLRYDIQTFRKKERKRNRKISEKEIRRPMIVFDRLIPMNPSLEGNPAFMVPEVHIQDALVEENGRWQLVRDIDARNQAGDKKAPQPSPPQQGLFPPE
jgi:hypothetical protein